MDTLGHMKEVIEHARQAHEIVPYWLLLSFTASPLAGYFFAARPKPSLAIRYRAIGIALVLLMLIYAVKFASLAAVGPNATMGPIMAAIAFLLPLGTGGIALLSTDEKNGEHLWRALTNAVKVRYKRLATP